MPALLPRLADLFGCTIDALYGREPPRDGGPQNSAWEEVSGVEREQTTIRLPAELKEQLQGEAAKLGMSLNAYLLWLIDRGRQCLRQ